MSYGDRSLHIVSYKGLGILLRARTRSGVAHVTYSDITLKLSQYIMSKNITDESHILKTGYRTVIVYGNAAALLPPVL